MKATDGFSKQENVIRRSYDISEKMYTQLEFLSKNIYNASVNKLVCAAIKHLVETENVCLFIVEKSDSASKRTFAIPESLVVSLDRLSNKYDIGTSKLVNIAVQNLLKEESEFFETP